MANAALAKMGRLFAGMYEAEIKGGRPSIAPEKLLRAMLLQVLYSVRSERQSMEQVRTFSITRGERRHTAQAERAMRRSRR